jgi:flavin reductase (DIM6/NTAB) family NADH-FMN oxidoreductase RutF
LSRPPNPLASVSPDAFRETCSHFATGVTVATVCDTAGFPHGLTVTSFAPVSLNPPLVLICVDLSSSTHATFLASPFFAVNVLADDQRSLSIDFAALPEGRFDRVDWRHGQTGAPLLQGVLASFECQVVNRLGAGDHTVLIGEVVHANPGNGRPLLYFGRDYHYLAKE